VINYISAQTEPIAPAVEGRIVFQIPFRGYLPFVAN